MKNITKRLAVIFVIFLLMLSMIACRNSVQDQQKIIDTFSSFTNLEQYILVTRDEIHIGKEKIDLSNITYNGERCHFIVTEQEGAYAYSYEVQSENSVNIVYICYETLDVTLLANVKMPSDIITTEYYDAKLYFRMDDPETERFKQIYIVYDILTKETYRIDTNDLPYDIEASGDHNRSTMYMISVEYNQSRTGNCLKITQKETGESKIIENALLNTCEEGRRIIELGEEDLGTGCSTAYEKNGDIYVLFLYVTDGFLGDPCHYYIMKYNFESHTLEYYTSVFFETYPGNIYDLYIPR